jgi:transcriptional regulator with XRE-family HTH domain
MAKPTLIVNLETLNRLRDGQPWGVFAKQIGIDGSTLSRVRNGKSQPGPEFIASVVTNFPVRMEELVTVVAA